MTKIKFERTIIFVLILAGLISCNNRSDLPPIPSPTPTPTPMPTPTPTPEIILNSGAFDPNDFEIGPIIQEVVPVWNCDNPLERRDSLQEARSLSRNIEWDIRGQIAANVEASIIAMSADVEAAIELGYSNAVQEQLQRGRNLDLPVAPYSSVEYIIQWEPIVWKGQLPFEHGSGEDFIEYQYHAVSFGQVVGYLDKTEEVCGRIPISSTIETPTSEPTPFQEINTPAPTNTPSPTSIPVVEPQILRLDPPIVVPGFLENGYTFTAPKDGIYIFTILDGAYSPWPSNDHEGNQGWLSTLYIYKNRAVEWGLRETGLIGPIQQDYSIGWGEIRASEEEAVAIARGLKIRISLLADDTLVFVPIDEQTYYTFPANNRGEIVIQVEVESPSP